MFHPPVLSFVPHIIDDGGDLEEAVALLERGLPGGLHLWGEGHLLLRILQDLQRIYLDLETRMEDNN